MTRPTPYPLAALAALSALAGSCGGVALSERPARVNDLVGWIERVHVESELAKEKVQSTIEALRAIATQSYQDEPVQAFARFTTSLEESEKQAEKLREAVDPMKRIAGPVFDQWTKDLESFSSPSMRQRSQERLIETRHRYNEIVTAVEPTQAALNVFNKGMRDHALFLGHDFNPASVSDIQADVVEMDKLAVELTTRFDACLRAARAYVQEHALPVAASPGTMSPSPGGETRQQDDERFQDPNDR